MEARLVYSRDELIASHAYAHAHQVQDHRFHGGFLQNGQYIPPRTLHRIEAIRAWTRALEHRGWPLVDCSKTERSWDVYPSLRQQILLLSVGCRQSLWDELTIIGVNEAKGEAMCYIKPLALQDIIRNDITDSLTGHLWKGLFWAHGVDEAGDRQTPEVGGHKQMWFVARDLLLGENAYPWPEIAPMHSRPKAGREAPVIPPDVERVIEACMATLHVECRAFAYFQLCLDLCKSADLFDAKSEDVELAAEIIRRIRLDEGSHVEYLRCLISEIRSFTFRDSVGDHHRGADIVDPIWERQVAWPDPEARRVRREATRARIEAEVRDKLEKRADALLERFDKMTIEYADAT